MKNKFKILSIFAVIAIIFIGVDLKEVKAESYQISFKENELCIVEEEKCSFSYNTNAEEISNIEVHYIINGVDYTSDKETTVPGQGHVPKEYLTQTENTITVYEKNTSTNAETNRININLIAVHESKEVENLPDNDLKIYMSLNFTPIDAKVSIKKVTDKNILNKLGTNYVYHFQLLSGSKNIYDLNLEGAISGFMTPAGTKVKLEIPSEIRGKLNTTASHNEDLYFLYIYMIHLILIIRLQ